MKKHVSILLLLMIVQVFVARAVVAEMPLKVGVYQNFPLTYTDERGAVKGVFIDILDHIALKEGWVIEYVPDSWPQCLKNLESGAIDLLGVIAYSEQRRKVFDFMYENVLTEWAQVYINKDSRIESILDLEGKKVAVLKDDLHFLNLKDLVDRSGINCRFIEAYEYEDVLGLTEIGKCDAGLVSQFYGIRNERAFDIQKSPIIISPQKLYFAAPKGKSPNLIYALDRHMRALKKNENSAYYDALNRYFGVAAKSVFGKWLKPVMISAGVLLLLFFFALLLFRAQVKVKTRELSDINETLRSEIDHRKKEEKMRTELEAKLQRFEKMEALGNLAGGVAHDLNNILSGLVSYPELILLDLPEESPLRKPIITIKNSGERAAAIVQDLLTLARRGIATIQVVNINQIVSDYLNSPEFENLKALHAEVDVETRFESDLFNIRGSPVHLSKTVMNLVSNAAEAITGGGTISISTENRYIDKPVKGYDDVDQGNYVTLTVSDNGIGISTSDIEKIFEPFFTKKKMGRSGSGLGMAVVWGTVKDHNGYIDVESASGKGTTFTIYFPVTRQEIVEAESLSTIQDLMGQKESILVIDDVEDQRVIASSILEKLNYTVKTVASGEDAVNYMKSYSADLLVLDMIMEPGIDGLETYQKILQLHPNQRAVIASGFSETDRAKEAQRLGAGAYIKKPYTLDKIGIAIKVELAKSSSMH